MLTEHMHVSNENVWLDNCHQTNFLVEWSHRLGTIILMLLGLDPTTDCVTWSRSQNSHGPDLLVYEMEGLFLEYKGMMDFKNILMENYHHVNIISFLTNIWIVYSPPKNNEWQWQRESNIGKVRF